MSGSGLDAAMQKLRLVTSSRIGLFHDDAGLPVAFTAQGIKTAVVDWHNIAGDDPALIRTPWDYTSDIEGFLGMFDRLDAAGAQCINPTELMRWNLDKRYLLELAARGHDIVPTRILPRFSADAVQSIADQEGWDAAIAKPVQGAGAEGLVVVQDGGVRSFDASGNTWSREAPATPPGMCLVQPLMPSIETGEWSLFYFGGAYSHAVLKSPAAGDIRIQEEHGGTSAPGTPPAAAQAAAEALVHDVPDAVYARVDGVMDGDTFRLMELELIEPELYFRYTDGGEARFAAAVAAALKA